MNNVHKKLSHVLYVALHLIFIQKSMINAIKVILHDKFTDLGKEHTYDFQ